MLRVVAVSERPRAAGLVAVVAVLLVACGGTGEGGDASRDAGATTSTSLDGGVDDGDGEDVWRGGQATLELDGERREFTLESCVTRPEESDGDATTLQIEGAASGGTEPATLHVVELVAAETAVRIQTISVRFNDAGGRRVRVWEAQRVINVETGEVDDLHGEGTTPLLEVRPGDELVVTATGAAYTQFDMTGGGDDGPAGTGDLSITCTRA